MHVIDDMFLRNLLDIDDMDAIVCCKSGHSEAFPGDQTDLTIDQDIASRVWQQRFFTGQYRRRRQR